uniref:ABC-type cobalamin/Fe3+-siderophores transport systems ATPase component-like protein n=1 Tax=Polynucleobacter necessarius subsp. necessarius (strain STIR1) TaxID=452638 RepID=B1XUI1_POLNS
MDAPMTSTTPPYAIDVQNLTVGYGSKVLMQYLNFTVNNGEIFVILGGFGCGKSSLLKNLFEARAKREGKSYEDVVKLSLAQIPMGRYGNPQEYGDTAHF